MKKLLYATLMLLSIAFCAARAGTNTDDQVTAPNHAIQIASCPNVTGITNQWISGFTQVHPNAQITTTEFIGQADLAEHMLVVSDRLMPEQDSWRMTVGHSVIIPIVNVQNPLLEQIKDKGMVADDFIQLLTAGKTQPIRCFMLDDQELISALASFTHIDPNKISAAKIAAPGELIAAVENDGNAIGFCRLADIVQEGTNAFPAQIRVLPIDKNKNGRLESFENIYNTPQQFSRGVWLGKYPRELCRNIYITSESKPTEQAVLDFLTWINNEGQNSLGQAGYYPLSSNEITQNLASVATPLEQVQLAENQTGGLGWIWRLGIAVLALIAAGTGVRLINRKAKTVHSDDIVMAPALNANAIAAPGGLYYDKSHTWAFMEQDGSVRIGVDDFIQHITGSLTQIKMKQPGETVRKGEPILTISRDGKQLEIAAPVSGIIKEYNSLLLSTPSQLNESPYGRGWVYAIEPSNWYRETRFLFPVNRYREWLEDEFIRLKDFLAASANSSKLVLQDGGELADNFLGEMSPVVWEDFQVHFLNKSR